MRGFRQNGDQSVWRDPLELKDDQSFRGLSVLIAISCLFLIVTMILLSSVLMITGFDASLGTSNGALVVPLDKTENETETTQRLLAALQSFDEIENATAIPADKRGLLLQPWLGDSSTVEALPILIEFKVQADEQQISGVLQRVSARAVGVNEDVRVYSNQEWQAQGKRALNLYFWVLASLMLSAMGSLVATLFFATRTILRAQVRNIDVLETLGADAGFIRKIFASFAVRKGFLAACFSSLLVLLVWLGLSFLLPKEGLGAVEFQKTFWPTLLVAGFTPFLASFLSWLGAVWGFRETQKIG